MKKNKIIIYLTLITLSLTALVFIKSPNSVTDVAETVNLISIADTMQADMEIKDKTIPSFIFDVGTRFNSIKKESLINLKSFDDLIGQEHAQRIVSYKSLSVIVLENSTQTNIKATTDKGILSSAQLELLKSFDYSTNLLIWADYTERNKVTGELEDHSWTPYLTIVPKTQALYKNGKEAIIYYLKHNSKDETANLAQDRLKPGKIFFTVSKEGLISNVEVVSTSGYLNVDEKIKDLISNLPGKWEPASNVIGDKVDQTLVISFGKMGC